MASATSATSAAPAPAEKTDGPASAGAPQGSPAVALASKAGTPPYASGSLYVGDLSQEVTEAILFDTFNAVGPVASVRVCRDAATRRSLGYAYVNFINLLDAERALDTMNFSQIKGRACRIMWSHRDPSLRKSGLGNIFVKNLAKSIDNKALFDTFSVCGNILSCKVAVNAKHESLGYGFVQFSEPEAAQNAIREINGMFISGEKVTVQAFKSKKERSGGLDSKKQYTNVYVKNLPLDFTKTKLDELFSKHGQITSSTLAMYTAEEWKEKLEKDELRAKQQAAKAEAAKAKEGDDKDGAGKDGKDTGKKSEGKADGKDKDGKADAKAEKESASSSSSSSSSKSSKEDKDSKLPLEKCKGFGFVNFGTPAQAQAAVDALHGTDVGGKKLFVSRAQKKEERDRELRDKFEAFKLERQKKYAGVNLYVKNLADTVDEKKLHSEFAKFGSITSHKIMLDEKKKSRGFGFVCFSSPDEATKAVTEMNGRMVDGKPLYVALAQRKEVRRAQLEQQYSQRRQHMGGYNNHPFNMYPPQQRQQPFFTGVRRPQFQGPPPQFQGQPMPMYGMPGGPGVNPRMMAPGMQGMMPPNQVQYQLVPQKGQMQPGGPMGRGGPMQPGRGGRGGRGGARGGMAPRGGMAGGPAGPGGRGRGGPTQPIPGAGPMAAAPAGMPVKFQQNAKNVQQEPATMPEPPMQSPAEPLTSSQLAAAPEEQRKQLLGERLFPLISQSQPKLAGKITGMLLEMDNGELLHLLESQPALQEKISEAIAVLAESEREEQAAAQASSAAAASANGDS